MSIKIENLTYTYQIGTPFESKALDGVDITIESGEFIGLIGHTGSGKSTLIQHLNALLVPTGGTVYINDIDIFAKDVSKTSIRKKVGLVFQYPEYQLFEETVEKDIAYGPGNLGLDEDEISRRVKYAMELTGLEFEKYAGKSPFELSGGQKRRVAIAGVLAMKPEVLVLDEPTAGLDPLGKKEILENLNKIHDKEKNTIILVSHSMEDVAEFADRILVMNEGKVEFFDKPVNVFKKYERLSQIGLDVPAYSKLAFMLRQKGFDIPDDIYTLGGISTYLTKYLKGEKC